MPFLAAFAQAEAAAYQQQSDQRNIDDQPEPSDLPEEDHRHQPDDDVNDTEFLRLPVQALPIIGAGNIALHSEPDDDQHRDQAVTEADHHVSAGKVYDVIAVVDEKVIHVHDQKHANKRPHDNKGLLLIAFVRQPLNRQGRNTDQYGKDIAKNNKMCHPTILSTNIHSFILLRPSLTPKKQKNSHKR